MKNDRAWYRTVEFDAIQAIRELDRLGAIDPMEVADKVEDVRACYFQEDYTKLTDLRDHYQLRLREIEAGV